jgi:adenylate kinase
LFNKPKQEGICDLCGSKLYQRDDDKEEAILNRLDVYKNQTRPLIDLYTQAGVMLTINGAADIEVVFNGICRMLDDFGHV